jgi:hypothetical protein
MRRLIPLLLLAVLSAGCGRVGGEAFQATTTAALRLTPGHTVGQTFQTANDHLTGVDLLVATFGEAVDPAGALLVTFRTGEAEPRVSRVRVPATALRDNDWVRVSPPEPLSSSGAAAIEVGWTGTSPVGLWANTPAAQRDAATPANDPYPGGELLLDGQRAPGDLAFRVTGDASAATAISAALRLARSALGRLGDAGAFAAVWALLLAGAVWLALRSFRRPGTRVQLRQRGPDEQQAEHQEGRPQQAHEPIRHA